VEDFSTRTLLDVKQGAVNIFHATNDIILYGYLLFRVTFSYELSSEWKFLVSYNNYLWIFFKTAKYKLLRAWK
jgi:hypothetical protein